jgi:hypothetical protein
MGQRSPKGQDNGSGTPSVLAASYVDVPKRFRFLNAEQFGTILAVQPLIAFLSQRQKWLR